MTTFLNKYKENFLLVLKFYRVRIIGDILDFLIEVGECTCDLLSWLGNALLRLILIVFAPVLIFVLPIIRMVVLKAKGKQQ